MPSFRVTMSIDALRTGVAPESVLPAAADAARTLAIVEASDIAVVAGAARITVRYAADDVELALQIGDHVASATAHVAQVQHWAVTERVGGRWRPC